MFKNNIIVILVVFLVIASSLTLLFTSGNSQAKNFQSEPLMTPSVSWSGNLIIYADGTVNLLSAPIVKSGDYYNLTGDINGSITIQRQGAIFNGQGFNVTNYQSTSPVQLSEADYITVENTNVTTMWASGIDLYQSSHDTIFNNTVTGMSAGIFVYAPYDGIYNNTVNMVLTDPYFSGIPTGIVTHSSYTTITGNSIYIPSSSDGVVSDAQHGLISSNIINISGENSRAIFLSNGYNIVENNSIIATGISSYGAYFSPTSQFNTVQHNLVNVNGNRSYAISSADGFNNISFNTISVNGYWSYGIGIASSGTGSSYVFSNDLSVSGSNSIGVYSNSYNASIRSNTITVSGNSTYGIGSYALGNIMDNTVTVSGTRVYGLYSSQNDRQISGNIVTVNGNSSFGLYLEGSNYLTVKENSVTMNGNHVNATWLAGTYTTLVGNSINAGKNNGTALYMQRFSDNNNFFNNSFLNSSVGFQNIISKGNTFTGNSLVNDTLVFRITGQSSNLYYHNNFINYSSYSIAPNSVSIWDNGYPSGGNYWSGYGGIDFYSGPGQNITGPDGIGDTQFNLTGSNVDYYPLMKPWTHPKAIFTETGLEPRTTWSVTFSGTVLSSTGDTVSYEIMNATNASYDYAVSDISGYTISLNASGTVIFNGSTITVEVTFAKVIPPPPPPPPPPETYSVKFIENGLPDGTTWSITLNGTTKTFTTSTIPYDMANGSYSYSTGIVQGYSPAAGTGTVTVDGTGVTVNIQFSVVTYSVIFTNVGLPSGMKWYVNLSSGQSFSSTTSSISMDLANGTYSYSVDKVGNYNLTPESGNLTVAGASPSPVTITFSENTTVPPPLEQPGGLSFWIYIIIGIVAGAAAVGITLSIYYRRK